MAHMLLLDHKLTLLPSWKGKFVHDILESGKIDGSSSTNSDFLLQGAQCIWLRTLCNCAYVMF
jgi:hypothetical protein